MPVCPKCHKMISERHYERHLRRCGTEHDEEARGSQSSAWADGAETEPEPGRDWKKVLLAAFVIALLVGSLVVFFVLYALSFL